MIDFELVSMFVLKDFHFVQVASLRRYGIGHTRSAGAYFLDETSYTEQNPGLQVPSYKCLQVPTSAYKCLQVPTNIDPITII